MNQPYTFYLFKTCFFLSNLVEIMVKPKDLIAPFPKNDPIVTIHDRVWYIPVRAQLDKFQMPEWNSPTLFPREGEIHIEYCSGNGRWIAEKAKNHPEKNWVAVEKRFDRARKIWAKIQNFSLPNLMVVCGEALTLSQYYLPSNSITSLYINFPDPWPKRRHAKHRLISPLFFQEASRILALQGSIILVTDDAEYSHLFLELVHHSTEFSQTLKKPGFTPPPKGYGSSFFEELFRSQGKEIRYHHISKKNDLFRKHSSDDYINKEMLH